MYSDAIDVKYLDGYRLEVTFETKECGTVDLSNYLKFGGVFSCFEDIEYFKKVYINQELGVLCWPDGLDIAPETIYSMATGKPLPEWMEK